MKGFFTLLLIGISLQSHAVSVCDVNEVNFPSIDCSFNPPFEVENLKFGNVDEVINSSSLRIGNARFELTENAQLFDVDPNFGLTNCLADNNDLLSSDEGEAAAFMVSEQNTRDITHIWFLNCRLDFAK